MRDFYSMEVQKYWAPTSSISPEKRRMKLEECAESGDYLWSEKFDGNFSRAIINPARSVLQTRGISKVTGTYSELQDKVFFWNDVVKAFQNGITVILGEVYLPGGVDKDVGSICRCLTEKAIARQKDKKLEWRIFDILAIDGIDLVDEPIENRIKYIPQVVSRINNSLVKGVEYHEMTPNFFDEIGEIFQRGGEGAVCYKKGISYTPGKRTSAWTTIKVKQEISSDIDALILSKVDCEKNYNGGDISHWQYWENSRTGEKVCGDYFGEYQLGSNYIPISKNYYFGWPGAILVGVYNGKGDIVPLCKVAGLTEEFKSELRDNFNQWYLCPVSISGMMVSTAKANIEGIGASIRHPILKSIRLNDIDPKDCTLSKIIN